VDSESRFRALFELAYPSLCRYARYRGLTGPDAEDLVAQTLEIAWRRIDDVPADDPMPWLYAVARNQWLNHHRRQRRRRDLLARLRAYVPPGSVVAPWNQAPCGPRWHR
jgi:RNA polymerase sigma-70 factor (ECF subfamily)